ncbi:MAG: VWA domain-containing protein [Candidatus Latescibacteria bacterium]|jgi:Ca-activated chloride channel homolog|nr:VWA domain-containing protein [Candidatus Latescibacterota bacterium]
MRFANSEFLYALGLVPLLLVFYAFAFKKKAEAFQKFGNRDLLLKLSRTTSFRRQRIKAGLIVLGITFGILAAARPQFGARTEVVKREGIEIMVALDVSTSMLAEDVKPNRLIRAKQAVRTLVDRLQGDRIGIVAFAGAAYLQCPMTTDYSAVRLFLDGLDTETISAQGTAIGEALELATKSFHEQGKGQRVIVLLTDGEDHEGEPVAAAENAAQLDIRIYPIGIGTSTGEPIPLRKSNGNTSDVKRDDSGSVVMSRLDELTLERIAASTSGQYYRSTLAEQEVDEIYNEIAELEKSEFESREVTHYEERFQFLLVVCLMMIFLESMMSERIDPEKTWAGRFE